MKNKHIYFATIFLLLIVEALYPTIISSILTAIVLAVPFISMKLKGVSVSQFFDKPSKMSDFLKFDFKQNKFAYIAYMLFAVALTVWLIGGHLIDGFLALKALAFISIIDFWVGYPIGYREMEEDKIRKKN